MPATETQVLEAAAREACPECGGSKVRPTVFNKSRTEVVCGPIPCPSCQATGRRFPELGRACRCTSVPTTPSNEWVKIARQDMVKQIHQIQGDCHGTGLLLVLDRAALDATAQRCGYPCSTSSPNADGGYSQGYARGIAVMLFMGITGTGPTRELAARAALVAVLVAEAGR